MRMSAIAATGILLSASRSDGGTQTDGTPPSGFAARAQELAEGKRESNPPLVYEYIVDRLPDATCEGEPNGDVLLFTTAPSRPVTTRGTRPCLDRMMQTAEIGAP